VEETVYQRLAKHAPELWLRALMATAYTFGFRKGELLGLRVVQVDLFERTIRLNPGTTKNGEGRMVKMTAEVATLLQACIAGKAASDLVFTREDGSPIVDFRKRWERLLAAAGCPRLAANPAEVADPHPTHTPQDSAPGSW